MSAGSIWRTGCLPGPFPSPCWHWSRTGRPGGLIDRFQAWGLIGFVALVGFLFRSPLRRVLSRVRSLLGRVAQHVLGLGLLTLLFGALFWGEMELRVSGEFTVVPQQESELRAEVGGMIEVVQVGEGDRVEAGDEIARLSDRKVRAALREVDAEIAERTARYEMLVAGPRAESVEVARTRVAKAEEQLRFGQSQLKRISLLHVSGLTSTKTLEETREEVAVRRKDLEVARGELRLLLAGSRPEEIEGILAELQRLEARREELEDELGRLRLVTPISGVVSTPRLRDQVGAWVEPGDLVAEIHQLETIGVEIAVPERDIADVALGQKVVLKARAFPSTRLEGTVSAIAPTVREPEDSASERFVVVRTTLDNSSGILKPRMTGHAKILRGSRSVAELLTRRLSRYVRVEFWSWW